jgi:hypothetical protein
MRRRPPYSPGFLGLWEKTDKVFGRVLDNPHREGDGRVPLASALLENVGDTRYVCGVQGGLSKSRRSTRTYSAVSRTSPCSCPKTWPERSADILRCRPRVRRHTWTALPPSAS